MHSAICRIVEFPKIADPRGNLTFVEGNRSIPFPIKRACWIYDVPGGQARPGYSCQTEPEVIVALSGSFDVIADDGTEQQVFSLNRSYYGLYVPSRIWRELRNFSTNSLCMILTSNVEADYIRDYQEFLAMRARTCHVDGL